MTSEIPDEIMQRARDLGSVGCGCIEDEWQTCEHVRDRLCERQAKAIARAIMEARAEGYAAAREQAAKVAEQKAAELVQFEKNAGFAVETASLPLHQYQCEKIATAIRNMEPGDE